MFFNSLLTKGRGNVQTGEKVGGTKRHSLLLLVLSVGDDVTQVFVVQVSSHVQREVCEHLIDLKVSQTEERRDAMNVLVTSE